LRHDAANLASGEVRLQKKRDDQIRRAKAAIYLAFEMAGPHMAVVLLNDALRQQVGRAA
jgi:hypothetical protein